MSRHLTPSLRLAALASATVLALSACSAQTQDAIARQAAKSTVARVVADRYPGIPVEPAINCVIDNASATQIYALAADSVGGPTASTVEVVADIAQKPETLACLGQRALPALIR